MNRLKRFWKRALGRLAWTLLKAAEFDTIAHELIERSEVAVLFAGEITKRFAEHDAAIARLGQQGQDVVRHVRGLHDRVNALEKHERAG